MIPYLHQTPTLCHSEPVSLRGNGTHPFEESFCEAEPLNFDGYCYPLYRVNATALRNVCEANLPPSETRYGFFDSLCKIYQYSSHAQNDREWFKGKADLSF